MLLDEIEAKRREEIPRGRWKENIWRCHVQIVSGFNIVSQFIIFPI